MNGNFARGVLASVSAAILGFAGAAWAQEFPSKPIRSVVPLAPGNAGDLMSRQIGNRLKDRTGWTVLTDNRPGADFAPAILATVQAPADGYTILQGYMSFAILPHTRKALAWDLRDISPLVRLNSSPSMVAANIDLPVNSLAELVAYSKANPGKVSLGAPPAGSTGHLSLELIRTATGLNYEYVPYKDGNAAIPDLLSGRIQLGYNGVADYIKFIQGGKMRPIVVLGAARNHLLPNTPTAMEAASNPDLDIASWYGYFVRTGTPAPLVARLERELLAVSDTPDMRAWMTSSGLDPLPKMEGAEVFKKRVDADFQRWGRVVKEIKFQPQ